MSSLMCPKCGLEKKGMHDHIRRCYQLLLARCASCNNKALYWKNELADHTGHNLLHLMTSEIQEQKMKEINVSRKRKHIQDQQQISESKELANKLELYEKEIKRLNDEIKQYVVRLTASENRIQEQKGYIDLLNKVYNTAALNRLSIPK